MQNGTNGKKVYVALSGGVDSAVSAALLIQQGYDVTGVYMKNWSGDDYGIQDDCPWEVDQSDAEAVCKHLGIPFRSYNFEKQYREKVVEYFFSEYSNGRTPNPDVMCNKEIKFKLFLERALDDQVDFIATGHYAKVGFQNDHYKLYEGKDENKNQVYFLYTLNQEQLSRTLFPLGELTKPEVRKIAKELKLPNADKPDSQGICFIGEINVLKFLMSRIPKKIGDIVDIETGEKVSQHEGVYFYTIGQRAKIAGQLAPYFYCKKDAEKNIMYVCKGHENPNLYTNSVKLENLHIIDSKSDLESLKSKNLSAVIRYRQKPQNCKIEESDSSAAEVVFETPQWAVASGQSLVLFDGDECLGGGIIKN